MKPVSTALIAALLVLAATVASATPTRTETARYVSFSGSGHGNPDPLPDCASGTGLGGGCFDLRPSDTNATISIFDDVASRVCATITLVSENGYVITTFCDSGRIPLHTFGETQTHLRVKVMPDVSDTLSTLPTRGTIIVVLESE